MRDRPVTSQRRVTLVSMLLVGVVIVLTTLVAPSAVGAQDTDEETPQVSIPGIIPEPNSGREPEVEGDPGTLSQYLVMVGIVAGIGLIVVLIARESRSKRDAQATRRSSRSEPVDETSTNDPESSARQ